MKMRKGKRNTHRCRKMRLCGWLAILAAAVLLGGCHTVGGEAGRIPTFLNEQSRTTSDAADTAGATQPSTAPSDESTTTITSTTENQAETTTQPNDTSDSSPPTTSPVRGKWSQTGESPADVEVLLQNPELPSGCETTAASMLLKAYGYPVSMVGLAAAIPKTALEYYNGRQYALHPSEAFLGNPATEGGYGIFPGGLKDTIQRCIDEAGGPHTVRVFEGASESDILAVVDSGHPLCVWSTMWLEEIVPLPGWYIKRGGVYTDEYFPWPGNEHCMVLLGYDESTVTVCDPLRGRVSYNRERFFRLFRELGGYALSLERAEDAEPAGEETSLSAGMQDTTNPTTPTLATDEEQNLSPSDNTQTEPAMPPSQKQEEPAG